MLIYGNGSLLGQEEGGNGNYHIRVAKARVTLKKPERPGKSCFISFLIEFKVFSGWCKALKIHAKMSKNISNK